MNQIPDQGQVETYLAPWSGGAGMVWKPKKKGRGQVLEPSCQTFRLWWVFGSQFAIEAVAAGTGPPSWVSALAVDACHGGVESAPELFGAVAGKIGHAGPGLDSKNHLDGVEFEALDESGNFTVGVVHGNSS